jgi:hypothetical protein
MKGHRKVTGQHVNVELCLDSSDDDFFVRRRVRRNKAGECLSLTKIRLPAILDPKVIAEKGCCPALKAIF